MNNKDKEYLSKFMSKILRHTPHLFGIKLNKEGFVNIDLLVNVLDKNMYVKVTREIVEEIVLKDNKQRYSIVDNQIRANQGHNKKLNIDIEFKEETPPDYLYHGTVNEFIESIFKQGLKPQSRQYVHLSKNKDIAIDVASRRGEPVILTINTKKMVEDGYKFYLSDNDVWLTKEVPEQYLSFFDSNPENDIDLYDFLNKNR